MALVKCKECGNKISSKAETCPTCGLRLNASPEAKGNSGCLIGLSKIIGGLVTAAIGLAILGALVSNKNSAPSVSEAEVTPTRKLEIGCEEIAKAVPEGTERSSAYENCMASGAAVIRAQERINTEGSQTSAKPDAVGVSETMSSPVVAGTPQENVPPATEASPPATPPIVPQPVAAAVRQPAPPPTISQTRQLEIRCEEFSKAQPIDGVVSRSEIYDSCVSGGMSAIRAQERINAEGSQTSTKP